MPVLDEPERFDAAPGGIKMEKFGALRLEMLKNPVHLRSPETGLDLAGARKLAEAEARRRAADPMLLAWYNGVTGEFSPRVECGFEDRPSWLVYAESRGGDLCIVVNDGEYVFVYGASLWRS
jgi:hypothetical protein